jgi:hypothetical protein
MVMFVHSEHGKRLSSHIGVADSSSFDNGPNVLTLERVSFLCKISQVSMYSSYLGFLLRFFTKNVLPLT